MEQKVFALVYNQKAIDNGLKVKKGTLVEYSVCMPAVYSQRYDAEFDARNHMRGEADVKEATLIINEES